MNQSLSCGRIGNCAILIGIEYSEGSGLDVIYYDTLGNLRTTTKFTTTTSVDQESTGTRTSVSAGNRKLKMQFLGRTTTALNVNKL